MIAELGTLSTLVIYGAIASYVVAMIAFAVDLSGFGKDAPADRRRRAAGIALSTAWLGIALHVGARVVRGIGAGRVPWAHMCEVTLMATKFTGAVLLVRNRPRGL